MFKQLITKEIKEFCNKFNIDEEILEVEYLEKPHQIKTLPKDKMAIYIFEKDGIFFKIGKVGKNSNARFQSQHYNANSCRSNLAKSILNDKSLNLELNFNLKEYIVENFNRVNIYINSSNQLLTNLLEAYLHYNLNPKYEG